MKTNTFSIVVGTSACNANCPFCVSKMTQSAIPASPCFDRGRFNVACRIVEQMRTGLLTVLLTGKGEPMLFPGQITRYLECINFQFPLIELQTNGTLIGSNLDNLKKWQDQGLTLVCISIASGGSANNPLMGIKDDSYSPWIAAQKIKDLGLNVRLNCTMTRVGTYQAKDCDTLIARANNMGIDQVTFREVTRPASSSNSKVSDWVDLHNADGSASLLNNYLLYQGATHMLNLPGGGKVFDYNGQNVAVSNCLTGTTDPDDLRQVIFFPDNRIAYDWRYPAARLL